MASLESYQANLQRAILLFEHKRYQEAVPFCQAAIAVDPEAPQGYALIARCWNELPGQRRKAIQAIDRAIALAPEQSYYFGLKGWLLVCQGRYAPALRVARQGLEINPECLHSLNAVANAQTFLGRWKKAEEACCRILELDPENISGLNLLAQAQRHLGRWRDSRETGARALALFPENSFGQANAGYAALAAGDHLRANEHFREALRMDPHSDFARRGLISSLRTRIWIIRLNTRLMHLSHRPATFLNVAGAFLGFIAGATLVVWLAQLMNRLYPKLGTLVFGAFFASFLLYIVVSVIVTILGDFFLLFDSLGRYALKREEKIKAIMPGIALVAILGFIFHAGGWVPGSVLLALVIFLIISIQYPQWRDRWQRARNRE